jgi:hypothetical protein
MMNSIRFQMKASLLAKGEAREPRQPVEGQALRQTAMLTASAWMETSGMVGDGMVGSCRDVKRGTRSGQGSGVHDLKGSEEPHPEGVRVLVGAKKSRNGDGAKEDRKVEA